MSEAGKWELGWKKVNAQIKDMLKQCDIVENSGELQMSNKPSVPIFN